MFALILNHRNTFEKVTDIEEYRMALEYRETLSDDVYRYFLCHYGMYIISTANKHKHHLEILEIESACMLALHKSIRTWKIERSKFISYFSIVLKNEILMALRKEKAEYLKMVVMHLDSPVAHGKGGIGKVLTLTETLPYYEKAYGNQEFEYHHLEDHVNRVINELYHTNPKKDIIRVIFWANVRDGHCQRSLGIKYGISQAQVSRIIKRIKLTMCKEYNKYHMTVMGEHFESKKRTHGERTKERNRQLHNEFRNGKTVRELARLYGLTTSVVYKSLQTVADQTRDYTDSENIAILMAYEDGEAVINIAKRLGKSTPAVYWKIRKGREERDLCAKN